MNAKRTGKAPDSLRDDLKGFEEVLDLYGDEKRLMDREKQKQQAKNINPFELFNFLEKEKTRLSRIDLLLREKIPNIENSQATPQLTKIQQERVKHSEMELIHLLSEEGSPLLKTIENLFSRSFNLKKG